MWADIRYYLTDHLGSVVATINGSGTLRNSYEYLPWGIMNQSTVADQEKFNYTGHVRDEELGTNYLYCGARYYDPKLRTFLAVDPMYAKYPELGSYVYCADNPIIRLDSDGRYWRVKSGDPNPGYITTYMDMALDGRFGPAAHDQAVAVVASSATFEFSTDQLGKNEKGEELGGDANVLLMCAHAGASDQGSRVCEVSINVDVRKLTTGNWNQTIPEVFAHEITHGQDIVQANHPLKAPGERRKSERAANTAGAALRMRSGKGAQAEYEARVKGQQHQETQPTQEVQEVEEDIE